MTKNQCETSTKPVKDDEWEPWETRLSLGAYLRHLSKHGADHVESFEKAGLDPSQSKPDG